MKFQFLAFTLLLFANNLLAQTWIPSDYNRFTPSQFFQLAAVNQTINYKKIDRGLLQAAMFYATNEERVKHGLKPFEYSDQIEKVASEHASDMVSYNFYSHVSRVKGKKTIGERFARENVNRAYIGENISSSIALQYQPGRKINIPRSGGMYTYANNSREVILPHTYLTYAREVVQLWMSSPAHRKSILNPNFEELGCGAQVYNNRESDNVPYFMGVQCFGSKN
ncbi:Cysteine-rich secretory protein family protein [Algoriphagus locisalis]|uniref:Cysteine-rich secretory protein family protein n=1 Tax=Algoriphagus locisalis TaxID=305507 RepID=A0A1I6Y2N9_9BACT|nr:CAP domain-containing protein [Algoriphagus locisalis]SFT44849.1 Cysteine-rich secretory protein family protein [Algoriphagus locisalis]